MLSETHWTVYYKREGEQRAKLCYTRSEADLHKIASADPLAIIVRFDSPDNGLSWRETFEAVQGRGRA